MGGILSVHNFNGATTVEKSRFHLLTPVEGVLSTIAWLQQLASGLPVILLLGGLVCCSSLGPLAACLSQALSDDGVDGRVEYESDMRS